MNDTLPPPTNGAGLSVITFHPFAAASADAMDRWSMDNDYDMGDEIVSDEHPAPWTYVIDEADGFAGIIDANGDYLCCWERSPDEAIGHLMARAPTLLAERDMLMRRIDAIAIANGNPVIRAAKDAVTRIRIVDAVAKP